MRRPDTSHNPYLDEFQRLEGIEGGEGRRVRKEMVRRYAWAVPNTAAIERLVELSPIVEMGAGNGYWKYVVEQAGGDVLAYDAEPWSESWSTVRRGTPRRLEHHGDRTLLLCWPPYGSSMAAESLSSYCGGTLVYIGERGGCTANGQFHERLRERWEVVETVEIPSWPCVWDDIYVCRRVDE